MTDKDIKKITDAVVERLEQKSTAEKKLTTFQKTEKLLYELKILKNAITTKEKMVEHLKKDPVLLTKKSTDLNVQKSTKYLADIEKIENKIENLESEIARIQSVVDIVESAVDSIRDNKHFKIIELKYFKEMTHEEIAEELYINEKTVRRNKNYLIKQLQLCIFPKDTVREYMV